MGIELALVPLFFLVAMLYASVGHAGASGYLALMALSGFAPGLMRPTALILNVLVATLGSVRYARAGLFRWRDFWPFALTSVPTAFIVSKLGIAPALYRPAVALLLAVAAVELVRTARREARREASGPAPHVPLLSSLAAGILIGALAGLTGTGGGIFLSPVLLLLHWQATRPASGVVAAFVLANSLAGLAGTDWRSAEISPWLPAWIAAVVAGGWLGTRLGISGLAVAQLRYALALVLCVAAVKMLV